jgi:hypothetical protein
VTRTRTFTRDQLDALGVPHDLTSEDNAAAFPEAAIELHREQVDTRRWVSVHELIFRAPDDGKAYRVHYEQGLTEIQEDTDPWDYTREVEAVEVEQRQTTVTEWHPADDEQAEPKQYRTDPDDRPTYHHTDVDGDRLLASVGIVPDVGPSIYFRTDRSGSSIPLDDLPAFIARLQTIADAARAAHQEQQP